MLLVMACCLLLGQADLGHGHLPNPTPPDLNLTQIHIAGLMYLAGDHDSPFLTLNSIQQQGTAAEMAVIYLRQQYSDLFNFTHTYLYRKDRSTGALLEDDAENLIAQFYNGQTASFDGGLALISPCESTLV